MKHLSSIGSYLVVVLLFFTLSCTDHDIKEQPDLETLVYGANCKFLFTYKLNVRRVGDFPVTEYGIVWKPGNAQEYQPGVTPKDPPVVETDTKAVFDMPLTLGEKQKFAGGACGPLVYYRTYAILKDGTVVYGNLLAYRITG
jgi:hypothetical protein